MITNDITNEALALWAEIVGYRGPDRSCEPIVPLAGEGYALARETTLMNKARTWDASGLTTFMLLRSETDDLLRRVSFRAHDLLLAPDEPKRLLGLLKQLHDILETPEVVAEIEGFQQLLLDAADHYGYRQTDELEKLLGNKHLLSVVRRDALKSVETLPVNQFTQGPGDHQPLKLNEEVFEFWNLPSLLHAMQAQKVPGITLCLLRDSDVPLASFFAFAIRDGATLSILSDKPYTAHPTQKKLVRDRRMDRDFAERTSAHWFPYELLKVKPVKGIHRITGEEVTTGFRVEERKQLVPINTEAVPLAHLRDLDPETFVWLVLVANLLREKFQVKRHTVADLSYTGAMIVEPEQLVSANAGLVKDGLYTPLKVEPLTKARVEAGDDGSQYIHPTQRHKQWMVDRYRDQVAEVPDFAPVGEDALKQLTTTLWGDQAIAHARRNRLSYFNDEDKKPFERIDPLAFGTAKALENDRMFLGRINYFRMIQERAEAEFRATEDEVVAWAKARFEANKEKLLAAVAAGGWPLASGERCFEDKDSGFNGTLNHLAFEQKIGRNYYHAFPYNHMSPSYRLWTHRLHAGRHIEACWVNGEERARLYTSIRVQSRQALCELLGVEEKDLPWQLQHWSIYDRSTGNHLLNRIDPIEWVLENPWCRLHFDLMVGVSLATYHKLRKAAGLPRKEWGSSKRKGKGGQEQEQEQEDEEVEEDSEELAS